MPKLGDLADENEEALFLIKYTLGNKGVIEKALCEVIDSHLDEGKEYAYRKLQYGSQQYVIGRDAFRDGFEAMKMADRMREKKMASLKVQIMKLSMMKWKIVDSVSAP
jgi:hypothetical protein